MERRQPKPPPRPNLSAQLSDAMREEEYSRAVQGALQTCTDRQRLVWQIVSGMRLDGTHQAPTSIAEAARLIGVRNHTARTHYLAARAAIVEALLVSLLVGIRGGDNEDFEALMSEGANVAAGKRDETTNRRRVIRSNWDRPGTPHERNDSGGREWERFHQRHTEGDA